MKHILLGTVALCLAMPAFANGLEKPADAQTAASDTAVPDNAQFDPAVGAGAGAGAFGGLGVGIGGIVAGVVGLAAAVAAASSDSSSNSTN